MSAAKSALLKIAAWLGASRTQAVLLFLICLFVLLRTMFPTLYTFDSAEFAIGAKILGLVHAPGYALYLLVAHLFTLLPIGDVAYRVNLFSAVCLAACAPVLFAAFRRLIGDSLVAAAAALTFVWGYYVWQTGLAAEIYALQLLTLAACGTMLIRLYRDGPNPRKTLLVGVLYGVAVTAAPTSILFAPGLILAFRLLRIPWRTSILAAAAGALVFCLLLAYYPIRYAAAPALNIAGQYDASGIFHSVNLQTVSGLWWLIQGQQFHFLFFAHGLLPTFDALRSTLSWFWGNMLGVGVVIGLIGAYSLYKSRPGVLAVWLVCFLPYTYFFTVYGADDRDTMFGPSYLLWAVLIVCGLDYGRRLIPRRVAMAALVVLPLVFLAVNFPLLDESHNTTIRDYAAVVMRSFPPNAVVFAQWWDIVPLQYLQIVENQRRDVELYNIFLFQSPDSIAQYVRTHTDTSGSSAERPVIFLGTAQSLITTSDSGSDYVMTPLLTKDTGLYTGASQITRRIGDTQP